MELCSPLLLYIKSSHIQRFFFKGSGKTRLSADCQPWREDLPTLQISPAIARPHAMGPGAHLCGGRCGGVPRRALHQLCIWDHQGGGPVQYQSLSRSGQSSHSSFALAGICNLGGLSCAAHGVSQPPPQTAASHFHSASYRKHSRARIPTEPQACQGPRQRQQTLLPAVRQLEHRIGCPRVQDTLQGVACPPAENSNTSGAEPNGPVW